MQLRNILGGGGRGEGEEGGAELGRPPYATPIAKNLSSLM